MYSGGHSSGGIKTSQTRNFSSKEGGPGGVFSMGVYFRWGRISGRLRYTRTLGVQCTAGLFLARARAVTVLHWSCEALV